MAKPPILYDAKCYVADDGSQGVRVRATAEAITIRMSDEIVVPHAWRPEIVAEDKGFRIAWATPSGPAFVLSFAFRTFFMGYDTAKRDEAVATLNRIVDENAHTEVAQRAAAARAACEACGDPAAVTVTLPIVYGVAFKYSLREQLRTLFRRHHRRATWLRMARNNCFGFFGVVSTFAGGARNLRMVREARAAQALGPKETWLASAIAVGMWPYVLLAIGAVTLAETIAARR